MLNKRDFIKNTAPLFVLATLAKEDAYTFQITQKIRIISEDGVCLTEKLVDTIVLSLERKGFVKSTWEIYDVGPARKYHALTAKGKKELKKLIEVWNDQIALGNKVLNCNFFAE